MSRKMAAAAGGAASDALETQSKTIAELMAAREALAEKLRASQEGCLKLQLERQSVLETLQDLPADGDVRFNQV